MQGFHHARQRRRSRRCGRPRRRIRGRRHLARRLTPIIALIVGEPDFSGLTFEISGTVFSYGPFVNSLISFVSIAGAIYFFVVVPMNRLKGAEEVTTWDCPECTTEIPLAATRCPACTAQIAAAT